MNYKKYLIHCHTAWCGEDNTYAAIAEEGEDISEVAENASFENYMDFGGFSAVLEDMFPEVEDGEYTEEQEAEAANDEYSYYGYSIEEFNESGDQEWDWFELIYDASDKK